VTILRGFGLPAPTYLPRNSISSARPVFEHTGKTPFLISSPDSN
jgi:hypothetical protein